MILIFINLYLLSTFNDIHNIFLTNHKREEIRNYIVNKMGLNVNIMIKTVFV